MVRIKVRFVAVFFGFRFIKFSINIPGYGESLCSVGLSILALNERFSSFSVGNMLYLLECCVLENLYRNLDYSQMDYRTLISYRVNVTYQYERSFMRTTTQLTRVLI